MREDDYFLFFFLLAEILKLTNSKYKLSTFYIDRTLWLCYKILNQLCFELLGFSADLLFELSFAEKGKGKYQELDSNSWALVFICFFWGIIGC